ncbi:MAG TPA: WecB/TagA/CpsF family glycosyltransferase [Planctomycetota bacterium]|nr:WecB/TagA/CpsF family glycosyltransferase [Planctomycetota bacterium]
MDIAANTSDAVAPAPETPAISPGGEPPKEHFPRYRVLSAAVDVGEPQAILEHLTECAQNRKGCSVVGISAPYATAMADDETMRSAFLKADLLIPDGKGFTWGARMLGVPCGDRIAIPDLCEQLLSAGSTRGWKVFIYGATPEVNAAACENVKQRFPGLATVRGQHGYEQTPERENEVIATLADEQFNLLIVARPSPDKELFLARCCHEAGVVGLAAGGYADILAGITTRAPALVQAIGMEWLYRIVQEPGRLWKRIGWANVRFACAVLWGHLRKRSLRPWYASTPIHASAILLAVIAAYVGVINAPYHFDDPEYIQENPTIRTFSGLSNIKVLSFRKLWWLSNAVCYRASEVFGNHQVNKPDVRIFRAWNLICHFIAALALYGILRRVLRASGKIPSDGSGAGTPYDMAAFAAAAIFAAHPLCTESVTYISGRDNGQGGMFYLLGLYAAAVAFGRMGLGNSARASGENVSGETAPRWPDWFWPATWMVIFGGCSILTKESHLTFFGAAILLYAFFFRGSQKHTISLGLLAGLGLAMAALAVGAMGRQQGYLGPALQFMLLFSLAGGVLGHTSGTDAVLAVPTWRRFLQQRISMNWAFVGVIAGLGAAAIVAFPYAYQRTLGALTGYLDSDYMRSLFTQANAVPWMLLRAIVPYGLNIDHDFPTMTSFSDPRVQTGTAVIALLVVLGLIGLWRRWLGGFGILFALLVIAPTNTIIERGDVVSERNFYLVAAGGAMFLAWLIVLITSWIGEKLPAQEFSVRERASGLSPAVLKMREAGLWAGVLGCCITGPFVSLTILRNDEWSDGYKLWNAARQRSPDKMRVLYNFGVAAFSRKKYDEADAAFNNLIRIGEWMAERKEFRPDETVQIKCFHLAYANLATMHLRRYLASNKADDFRSLNEIDKIYRRGLERTVYDPDLSNTYAQYLMQIGRISDVPQILQHSLNLHPWAEQIYYPLGVSYVEMANFPMGEKYLNAAINVKERHTTGVVIELPAAKQAEVHAFLALAKLHQKRKDEARQDFRRSLELDVNGTITVFLTSSKTQNPKLKLQETNPPDLLLMQASVTRRDVLEALMGAIDDVIKSHPEKDATRIRMLRNVLDSEIKRRGAVQKKRNAFGFLDDPDED